MKRALFLVKSPPYGTLRVTEGYRAALGTVATGTPTGVVLLGDGVYAALRGQDSSGIEQTCVGDLLEGLAEMDVRVSLHGPSCRERGLDGNDLLAFPEITSAELKRQIEESHAIFTF